MQNYKESLGYRFFVVGAGTLTDATKSTADLAVTQVGMFNAKKGWKAVPVGTPASQVPEVVIAYGSPNTEVLPWTNSAESIKTGPIKAKNVVSFRKSLPKRPKNHIVTIGWDGINASKTITAKCEETYSLLVQIEGSPASRFFGGKPFSELFVYETGCCGDQCEPVTDCDKPAYDAEKVVDYFISQINNHKWMKEFVKAEKLVAYTEAPSPTTVAYDKYQLSICDEGTAATLGKLQSIYGTSVVRVDRVGSTSTCELVQLGSASAPANFSTANITTIANCDTCPEGYELVEGVTIFKLVLPAAFTGLDSSDLAGIIDFLGEDVTVESISVDEDGTVTLIVTGAADTDFTELLSITILEGEEEVTKTSAHTVSVIGTRNAYCELETACEYPWTLVGEYVKYEREITLTMGVEACKDGAATLADMIAFYASFPDISDVALTEDEDCGYVFTANQLSSNLVKLSDCGVTIPEFKTPEPYKGFLWEAVEVETDPANITNIGIKLTGVYVNTQFGSCSWHYDDFIELDIPKIIVRQGNDLDQLGKCADAWPVTVLQNPEYPSGIGANVQKDYIEQSMFLNQCFTDDRRWREIHGYDYDFIDRKKFYVLYYLTYASENKYDKYVNQSSDQRTTITFAVEESDVAGQIALENLLGQWVNSEKPDLLDGDWLFNAYR